ncbi:MAG: alpha/beta hydrolase [Gemmatimonadaceae bacterium]
MRKLFFALLALCACRSERASSASPSVQVDTGRVAISGGSLYYESAGSGETLVLLHGGNLDRRMWDVQFALLRQHHHVVRYDARGFGRSSAADQAFAAHDDLTALLQALKISHATLIGLSMGGRIAIDFALAHPEVVDRLILAAPGISGGHWAEDGDSLWQKKARIAAKKQDSVGVALAWLESAYIRTALQSPEQVAFVRDIVMDNARFWSGIVRHGNLERDAEPPAADRLSELHMPILLMVGGNDTPFIKDVARAISGNAPHVKRVDIPGVGHMLNLEASEQFDREVLSFLASASPSK